MSSTDHAADRADEPVGPLGRLAPAGLLAAAGGLHLAALPGHLSESTAAGAFFALTAAAQLLAAVLVATRSSLGIFRAVVAGNVGVLTLWLMSRTIGLPIAGELGVSEPIGLLDGFATAAELVVVVAGGAAIFRRSTFSDRRPATWRLAFALALMWGLSGGGGLAMAGDGHHHGDAHAHGQPVRSSVTEPGCHAASGCSDHRH